MGKDARRDIDVFGFHIVHVEEDEAGPPFSYTIGIYEKKSLPEMIVVGANQSLASHFLWTYYRAICEGNTFESGYLYSGFLDDFDCLIEVVDKKHYECYVGQLLNHYNGDGFDLFQLVFPNTSGIFPGEDGANEWLNKRQPRLSS